MWTKGCSKPQTTTESFGYAFSTDSICCAGVLNLIYDAMPADFVTLIVTEFGLIPPTSVPVILREYRQEPAL